MKADSSNGRYVERGDVLIVELQYGGALVFTDTKGGSWYSSRFVLVEDTGAAAPPWQQDMQVVAPDPTNPAHYSRFPIQPLEFITKNGLSYLQGNVIKYVCRYDAKNGIEDLRKARRYVDLLIEAAS